MEARKCKRCGSGAINEHLHGRREGLGPDLCDVCYWRNAYESLDGVRAAMGYGRKGDPS